MFLAEKTIRCSDFCNGFSGKYGTNVHIVIVAKVNEEILCDEFQPALFTKAGCNNLTNLLRVRNACGKTNIPGMILGLLNRERWNFCFFNQFDAAVDICLLCPQISVLRQCCTIEYLSDITETCPFVCHIDAIDPIGGLYFVILYSVTHFTSFMIWSLNSFAHIYFIIWQL